MMQVRHELENTDLMPLPYFYIEKRVFLGEADWKGWQQMICQHGRLLINYYDIYSQKQYSNLLYPNEYKNIETSRMLRWERSRLSSKSSCYNKILLGTTLLPKPIVECLLDDDDNKKKIASMMV